MADEKIQVTIEGNADSVVGEFKRTTDEAEKTKKKLSELSDVDKVMDGLTGKLAQLTLGFGTAAGAASWATGKMMEGLQKVIEIIPEALRRTNELAASYQMMSVTAGMNSDQFNKFNVALQMSGGETEKMLPLIRGYARAMRTRADVLILNGIAQDKASLAAMSFEQYITKVVAVMETYGSHMDKDLLLQAAFERSGIANAAMLKNLARNFEEAGHTARRNGIDMDDASKNLNTYRVAATELTTSLDKMKASLASFLIPGTSKAIDMLARLIEAKGVLTTLAGFALGNVDLVRRGANQSSEFVAGETRKTDDEYSRRREEMRGKPASKGKFEEIKTEHQLRYDNFQMEMSRLSQQEISMRDNATLDEKLEAEKAEISRKFNEDRIKYNKELTEVEQDMAKKDTTMTLAEYNRRYAEYEVLWNRSLSLEAAGRNNASTKMARVRADLEMKLQEELTVGNTDGLAQRYAKNQEWATKTLKDIRGLYLAEDAGAQFEAVAIAKMHKDWIAFTEQRKKDLSELNTLLKQENDKTPMSQAETKAFIEEYGKGSASKKSAADEKTSELHLDGTAGEGALAGLKKFRAETENIYVSMQHLTLDIANSMSTGISKSFTNMIMNGEKFGAAMKALWKDVASSAIGGLIQIASREALNWALEGTILAAKKTASTSGAAAQTAALTTQTAATVAATSASEAFAAAEIWAAYGWIPGGQAIAAGLVAAMMASIAVAAVPKLAQGAMINSPTLAIIGEAGPEIVAPQKNFMDWANANQNLGYNLASHNANVSGLNAQGNSYGSQGLAASGGSVPGGQHVDARGSFFLDSAAAKRTFDRLVTDSTQRTGRASG